jgi:hypothetical protein
VDGAKGVVASHADNTNTTKNTPGLKNFRKDKEVILERRPGVCRLDRRPGNRQAPAERAAFTQE